MRNLVSMTARPVRVLLVEDSLPILKQMLSASPEVELVGAAKNGKEAMELIPQVRPEVICTEFEMPVMDGLGLTKEVMAKEPRAILVIDKSAPQDISHQIFQVLEAGALDVFPKPNESEYQAHMQALITKIKILSGVRVLRKRQDSPPVGSVPKNVQSAVSRQSEFGIIVIGASTGGPQALQHILSGLPADFPIPVICVQHISKGFLYALLDWLASKCPMHVKIAQSGETPKPGTVYFPPENSHLEFDADGRLLVSMGPLVNGHRPSINVSFKAASRQFGKAAIAVLLTGMGQDGAEGMRSIAQAGGLTIVQDERSCVVFGMPQRAIELQAASHILPLSEIASMLRTKVSK